MWNASVLNNSINILKGNTNKSNTRCIIGEVQSSSWLWEHVCLVAVLELYILLGSLIDDSTSWFISWFIFYFTSLQIICKVTNVVK